MSLRNKLIISFFVILSLIVSLLFLNSYLDKQEERYVQRLLSIHHQYTTLLNLKNDVTKQLSEAQQIFIYGKEVGQDNFRSTTELIKEEVKVLFDYVADEQLQPLSIEFGDSERSRMTNLQHKYEDLYRELMLMTKLIQIGRKAKARQHFTSEIDLRFNDFFAEIDSWIVKQRQELTSTEAGFISLNRRHNQTTFVALTVIMVIVLIFSVVFMYLLGPRLHDLLQGTERIAKGDFTRQVAEKGDDEFSKLSRSMNQMMRELSVSRIKLLEQSYYSGMADMVAGTLHNLRNSLSPVVVDLESIECRLNEQKTGSLKKVICELQGEQVGQERRRDLYEYLALFCQHLDEQMPQIGTELSEVRKKIDVIEKVLNEHSRLAETERPLEEIFFHELVQDGLGLVRRDYLERVELLVDDMALIGTIKTQRIVLVQVVANLVTNGIESIIRCGMEGGRVSIKAAFEADGGRRQLHLQISDNGGGIGSDMLDTIFQRGISAKDERSGLGLHWCANSMAALDGRIYAESQGVGSGACLHVVFKC